MRNTTFVRLVSAYLACIFALWGLVVQPAQAEFIRFEEVAAARSGVVGAELARAKLRVLFLREDAAAMLNSYGLTVEEASARLGALSDEEVVTLAAMLDQAPAGGDGLGTVVGAVLFVFVLLLITDIIGFTKVFPFTRSIR